MDRLDQFFKNKMNERQVPFDEAHWQAAQEMLEKKDRKRRGFLWWWLAGIGLALLLSGVFYWSLEERTASVSSGHSTEMKLAPSTHQPSEDSEAERRGSGPTDLPSAAEVPSASKEAPPQSTEEAISNPAVPTQAETEQATEPVPQQAKTDSEVIAIGQTPDNHQIRTVNKQEKGLAEAKLQRKEIPSEGKNEINSSLRNVPPVVAGLPALNTPLELPLHALPEQQPEYEYIPNIRPVKDPHIWELSMSALLNPGDGKSVPGAGGAILFSFPVSQRIHLFMSSGYQVLNGTFGPAQESNRQAYGFGLSIERFQLTPSRLHFLTLGTGLRKSWQRHTLSAGMAYQHLLGVQGSLSKSEKPEFSSIFHANSEEGSGWMEKEGFNLHLFGVTAGYQLRAFGPLSLKVNARYFVNSLLDEAVELPSGELLQERGPLFIDLGISYRL